MTQKTLMWKLENEREQATTGLRAGLAGVGVIRALIAIVLIYAIGLLITFIVLRASR